MKCPYNKKSMIQQSIHSNNLLNEETGVCKGGNEILTIKYELMDCLEEECGVWRDGRCCYYPLKN